MQLIMVIEYSDGCTFSYTDTLPITKFSSAEEAILVFEAAAESSLLKVKALGTTNNMFSFNGHELDVYNFITNKKLDSSKLPEFYTVDEWFADQGDG